jgi:preprotein translocase subunit SecE
LRESDSFQKEKTMSEATSITQRAAAWPIRVKDYFEELQHEMKLVTWPSWKQVRATTGVVLAAVFAFGAYFFLVDNIIGKLVQRVYDYFTK